MGLKCEADVVVAGGGMAGTAAAIAAARTGARTVLVERAGWLGGIGITGATGLHSFYNIYNAEEDAPRLKLVGGIPQELVDAVREMKGGIGHVELERGGDFVSMLTPVDPEAFKIAAAMLCREAGVRLLLHTTVEDVEASDGAVRNLKVWSKDGFGSVSGKVFVDCTGDGDLAAAAGAPFTHYKAGDPGAYSAGFTFRMCNVDLAALEADLEKRGLITQIAHAVKPHMDAPELVRLGIAMHKLREQGAGDAPGYFLSSSLRPRELTYCNCINYGNLDALSAEDLTDAEVELRRKMFDVARFFRESFAGCEECYPAGPAPAVGPRRARSIRCDYALTRDDVTSGARHEDEVGLFGFIDNGQYFVRDAGCYGIPYRALLPRGLDNVLVAGRMMTEELVAHNSTRNTVCCMVCGQGAGVAAGLAARHQEATRALDVGELLETLVAGNVLLAPQEEPKG